MEELSDVDKAMIDLAAKTYTSGGRQDRDIRDEFDLSSTRFWQRVNYLIEQPAALVYDAQKVRRLHRMREKRKRQRTARARLK